MKRSRLLLISGILSAIYLSLYFKLFYWWNFIIKWFCCYICWSNIGINYSTYVFVGLAFIFNWIGWAMKLRWAALVAWILYAVSILLMFIFGIFVIIQMILCFVAFSKMKNIYY